MSKHLERARQWFRDDGIDCPYGDGEVESLARLLSSVEAETLAATATYLENMAESFKSMTPANVADKVTIIDTDNALRMAAARCRYGVKALAKERP